MLKAGFLCHAPCHWMIIHRMIAAFLKVLTSKKHTTQPKPSTYVLVIFFCVLWIGLECFLLAWLLDMSVPIAQTESRVLSSLNAEVRYAGLLAIMLIINWIIACYPVNKLLIEYQKDGEPIDKNYCVLFCRIFSGDCLKALKLLFYFRWKESLLPKH